MNVFSVLIVTLLLVTNAQGQVQKCTAPDGKVTYSDVRCDSRSRSQSFGSLSGNVADAIDLRREIERPVSATNASIAKDYRAAAKKPIAAGTVPSMSKDLIARTLTNPNGSQWTEADNAVMASNIASGHDPYLGTSRNRRANPDVVRVRRNRAPVEQAVFGPRNIQAQQQDNEPLFRPRSIQAQQQDNEPLFHGNAGTSYQRIGNSTFGSDGTSYQRIGSATFGSDGSVSQRIGSTTFNSNGTSSQQIGNTLFNSNGSMVQRIGNTTFDSNGSTCQRVGSSTFCN